MDTTPSKKEFINSFLARRGVFSKDTDFQPLAGDGSVRFFERIIPDKINTSFVIMENTPKNALLEKENMSYLMIGRHLHEKGLPVPEIFDYDLKNGWFILEDLGDTNLQHVVSFHDKPMKIYEKVLEILFRLQVEGASGFDPGYCCQTKRYDRYVMLCHESEYFRNSFLVNYMGIRNDLTGLDPVFDFLASEASRPENTFLLHRDFQSRNIMICDDKIRILDWQGARLGPLAYDLASLVIDPYTNLSPVLRKKIYETYLSILKSSKAASISSFEKSFPYLAIQRNLQILGAFSYLSKIRKKSYFAAFIPPALNSLNDLLMELGDSHLIPLNDILNSLMEIERKQRHQESFGLYPTG